MNLYAEHMPWRFSTLARIAAVAMFIFAAYLSHAEQVSTQVAPNTPTVIEGLGKGTATLGGPWEFHLGDNPAWANPAFDSSSWEQITADRPWGQQGHANYTGFAWYRCSITLLPATGVPPKFSLLVPKVDDAYEIYWNGLLIGGNGKLFPHPVWYFSQAAQSFELGQVQQGILAVRVWKAPLLSDDSGKAGGFRTAPVIGSPEAIANAKAALDFQWLRSRQFLFGENLLCALVAFLSFLLWLRTPTRGVLFWMTGYALIPPLTLLLLDAHIRLSYVLAMGVGQPLSAIRDISLWFLLIWLLPLQENRAIARLTRILACICLTTGILDGVLIAISWIPQWVGLVRTSDAIFAFIITLLEAFPLILAGRVLFRRKQLELAPWLVAISAFLDEMINVVHSAVKQGRQFTGWSIASTIELPLFTVRGSSISVYTLTGGLLLVAIVYAVYNSVIADQRRQDALEREKLELMRESERMRHYAEHDGLTGLWNHRVIVDRLREEMNRSRRDRTLLSVILIDIDYFKKINDSFGHPAGDLVLKEISEIFTRSLHLDECAGRYGGEEFLLILPGCDVETALIRAEQLRQAVQSARIMDGETTLQVTASFGVASDFPSNCEAEAVIRAVDTALYRAKSSGRNCVIPAEMDMPLCGS